MRGGRGKLYNHRHANMILHHRMNLHTAFLLATLGVSAYTFEYVVKKGIFCKSIGRLFVAK